MFTLLQIDDVDANRLLIERLLARRPDIRVLSASSGSKGLAMAVVERPHLILLDIAMPEMRGDHVLAKLKSNPKTAEIPVVVFSGSGCDDEVDAMLAAGATGSLPKPFTVKTFYDLVDSFKNGTYAATVEHV